MKNKEELLQNDSFCMMPWVHMHIFPNGEVYPCCVWDAALSVGNYNEEISLLALWNSPSMKQLRLNMLSGKKSEGCSRCYELERVKSLPTLRQTTNEYFLHHWDSVEKTESDGSLAEVKMNYLDIRFNNLCNLRCQTCCHEFSSSWYEDRLNLEADYSSPKVIQVNSGETFWNELNPLLKATEHAYFAGGEPLICDEHYQVLDLWLQNDMTDVAIMYQTNFSLLSHKKLKVLDYWKKFNNVTVLASLDDSGPRAEYLRKGTDWDLIVRNREQLKEACPEVKFLLTPTISLYNVYHFPEFHLDWVKKGFVKPNDFRVNILSQPNYMSVKVIPEKKRHLIVDRYKSYQEEIIKVAIERDLKYHDVQSNYDSVINFMNSGDDSHLLNEFFNWHKRIDLIRDEKLFETFPELREILLV